MSRVAFAGALLLVVMSPAAVSQPLPFFDLDTTVVPGPSPYNEWEPEYALAGDTGMVVWVGSGVVGTRITSDGSFLDTIPIDISGSYESPSNSRRVGLASDGRGFLAAWSGYQQTCFALVSLDGTVLQRTVVQDSVRVSGLGPDAQFDGTNYLVTWVAWPNENWHTGYFMRVTPDGQLLDSAPRLVAPACPVQQHQLVTGHHDDRYLVVWQTLPSYELWGTLISTDGSVLDSVGFPIREVATIEPQAVTHDGHNFVVAYDESHNEAKLARVTYDGQVLDTSGVTLDTLAHWQMDAFSVGDTTLVAWSSRPSGNYESTMVVAARVDTALRMIDSAPVVLSRPEYGGSSGDAPQEPTIGLLGGNYFVAWCQPYHNDDLLEPRDVVYRRLDRAGALIDTAAVIVSYGPNLHRFADLVSDGDDFLALWCDYRTHPQSYQYLLQGRRFTSDGTPLDSIPVRIRDGSGVSYPAAAYGADVYLVCWDETDTIWAVRVDQQGDLLDSVPIVVGPGGSRPDVACLDGEFLVVWYDGNDIFGTRLNRFGTVLDTMPIPIEQSEVRTRNPQVATDGSRYLVTAYDRDDYIRAVRVDQEGVPLDSVPFLIGECSGSARQRGNVAFGNSTFLVVASRGGPAWRVTPDGTVLDSAIRTNLWGYSEEVCFDGTQFAVFGQTDPDLGKGISAARISTSGRLLDSVPIHVVDTDSAGVYDRYGFGVATDTSGKVALAFQAYDYGAGAYRSSGAVFPAIVGVRERPGMPARLLARIAPNPVPRIASLVLQLNSPGEIRGAVYDASGRRRWTMPTRRLSAGRHSLRLDLKALSCGVYFMKLSDADYVTTLRLTIID